MGRLSFFVGFGAGYVLGSKAGRERYEQLRRLYDNLSSSPTVQRASGKAKEAVGTGLGQAKEAASEGVSKVTGKIKERRSDDDRDGLSEDRPGSLSVAPPPST
jgi:hypothetical protein